MTEDRQAPAGYHVSFDDYSRMWKVIPDTDCSETRNQAIDQAEAHADQQRVKTLEDLAHRFENHTTETHIDETFAQGPLAGISIDAVAKWSAGKIRELMRAERGSYTKDES